MEVYTRIPRNRINPNAIKTKKSTLFHVKRHSPCITVNMDNGLYLDKDGVWVPDVDKANVVTLEEAYNNTIDMPLTLNIEYVLIKVK